MDKRTFLRYASQNIAGMMALSCYILVDTWFVSVALGASGLAALNLAIAVYSVVSGAGQLLGMGGGTDFALRRAENHSAESSLPTALALSAGIALPLFCTGLFFSRPLTALLGADEATFALTQTYVRLTLLFSPVYILNALLQGFVRNDGSPRLSMLSLLVSSGMNIVLDYLFMFPLKMGMTGAVLATGIAACLSTPVLLSHFFTPHCTLRLRARLLPPRCTLRLASYGLSALIGELASAIALLTFNLLLMRMGGYIAVAAYGVIANAALIATAIFTGLGQGVQPLASRLFGEGDQSGIRQLLRYAFVCAAALGVSLFALAYFGAVPIASAFNHDGDTQLLAIATDGLRIYFAGYLFACISIPGAAFLSAVSMPGRALAVSVLRSCVLLIPCALALSTLMGVAGVWLSFVVTEAFCCLLMLRFLLSFIRRRLQ